MKALATILTICFLFVFTIPSAYGISAATPVPGMVDNGGSLTPLGTGGPDDYGYTWIDSDEPGGPTFQWVDITGIGTEVTGLGDDNSVGPFMVGFDFPYYWYTVDRFYVGSNGWISFSSGQNFAHPFARLPDANLPNDLVACLAGDIDFTKGGTCYYYTSPGLDSLVISYIAVPEFYNDPPSSHTFQIILTRADSSIVYQYGEQNGNFGAGGSNAFSMGMENNSGTIGLNYFYNPRTNPPVNPPPFADSTAIRFSPPDSTSFMVHDIGVVNALTAAGQGIFMNSDSSITPWSDLLNFGNQTESNYGASCIIKDDNQTTVYADSIQASSAIAPSDLVNFVFDGSFTPSGDGLYTATFGGHLPPGWDLVPENDELDVEIHGITYPSALIYDDGGDDDAVYWSGDSSGFGNEFEPPQYPTYVDYVEIAFDVQSPGNVVVAIHDDDGPGGSPGTVLASQQIFVNSPGLRRIDFTADQVAINDGKFFAAGIALTQETVGFMQDNTAPYSTRGWEFTGGWAPSRWLNESEMMIRVGVSDTPTSVGDGGPEVRLPAAFSLAQNYPNPFNPSTTIAFDVPGTAGAKQSVSLVVYDIRGRRVRTLVDSDMASGSHRVHWDGRNDSGESVSSGIFFYTLKSADTTFTRKMTVLK